MRESSRSSKRGLGWPLGAEAFVTKKIHEAMLTRTLRELSADTDAQPSDSHCYFVFSGTTRVGNPPKWVRVGYLRIASSNHEASVDIGIVE